MEEWDSLISCCCHALNTAVEYRQGLFLSLNCQGKRGSEGWLEKRAGMIRMEQEEFFIEPVERGDGVMEEGEEDGGEGRTHIVYRSSAVKKAPISSTAADYHSRGLGAYTQAA
ncbi:A disintegrin and metalloproteinase with thrombospondin motifs 3, partial [Dissostichus eleginoides]